MDENLTNTGATQDPAAGDAVLTQDGAAVGTGNPEQTVNTAEETRTVPVSVIQSVRDELKTARDQASLYRRQLEISVPRNSVGTDPFEGLADEVPLTAGQARKAIQSQASQVDGLASQLAFSMANPGFAETIKNNLPQMLDKNPGLMQLIRSSPNPLAAAYSIARLSPQAKGGTQPDMGDQMARIVKNSEKPGSAGSASGGAGISPASRIAEMGDAEFDEYKESVKAGKIKIGG